MKKKEIVLWSLVAVALAANIVVPKLRRAYSWERDLSQRLAVDFSRTRAEVKDWIAGYIPDVTDKQIDTWTDEGLLENMKIGGRTMYFHNAAPNLFRIVPELKAIKDSADIARDPSLADGRLRGKDSIDAAVIPLIRRDVTQALESGAGSPFIAQPRKMRVTFSVTVPANTLRRGSKLRCWLPYPREDVARQTGVRLIRAGIDSTDLPESKLRFSDPSCCHSSLYFEAKVKEGKPTRFYEVFEYVSAGEWHPVDPEKVLPYDTESTDYKEYTAEKPTQVVFSDRIRHIADSLTEGITNPYLKAKAIYSWVDRFPWASAREYSTISNIPEYVLDVKHGDCGQQTLLFMTLCRAEGIPTRWQSGLMVHPGNANLHDWCEAYFEGYGWIPVDQSFGETSYGGFFYFGGIDPYRLVFNSDFGGELSPKKKYPRSETVDFQRGEVEWEGGNLYFHLWDYDFEIEYLD